MSGKRKTPGGFAAVAVALLLAFPASAGLSVVPTCNGVPATIYVDAGRIVGGPQNGRLYQGVLEGKNGADVIVGTAGNDVIEANNGSDTACGGGGNDKVRGGNGADRLFGDDGNDELEGGNGSDTLGGGTGADKFRGGNGRDTAIDFTPGDGDTRTSVELQNAPPVAVNDSVGVMYDEPPTTIDVRGNDSDPNGDSFLVTAIGGTPQGAVSITGGGTGILYDPTNVDECCGGGFDDPGGHGWGDDSFTYTITDAHGATAAATVNVRAWSTADYAAKCIPLVLSDSTVDPGDTITVSGTSSWPHGAIIEVVLDGTTVLAQTTSAATPAAFWSTPVTIPPNTPSGQSTLQGVQEVSFTQPRGCPSQIATIDVS